MKRFAISAACALLLASCAGNDTGDARATAEKPCSGGALYSPIPGFALSVPVHMRTDKIYKKKGGEVRRGVMLEYLEGDTASAYQAVAAGFTALGYAGKKSPAPQADKNGVIKQEFLKSGEKSVYMVISPKPGKKPSNPEAKGTVWLSWQLSPPTAAPETAAGGASSDG